MAPGGSKISHADTGCSYHFIHLRQRQKQILSEVWFEDGRAEFPDIHSRASGQSPIGEKGWFPNQFYSEK